MIQITEDDYATIQQAARFVREAQAIIGDHRAHGVPVVQREAIGTPIIKAGQLFEKVKILPPLIPA